MLLDRLILDTTLAMPDKVAVVHGRQRVTYANILARALHIANALHEYGVRRGDRVIVALDNSPEYVAAYFGIQHAGGVAVAINPDVKPTGFSRIANDCLPTAVIAKASILKLLEAEPPPPSVKLILYDGQRATDGPPDVSLINLSEIDSITRELDPAGRNTENLAAIIYTSGTTGDAKGVMLSHRNLLSNTKSIISYLALSRNDSVMAVLPFYYSYGNSLLLTHVMQGGTLVIHNSFMYPNTILDQMIAEEVSGFAGVPSTFAILMHRSNFKNISLPSLRYITQAGGPMPHHMALDILNVVPHAKFYIMYGQTEASARLSYLPPEDLTRKQGSVGQGIPGVSLEVLDETGEPVKPGEVGEIVAHGENIMTGYWGREDETRQVLRDGRLYTGDMATVDEDGYIYIVSRKKEMIKSGAHRIAPREIEEVLLKYPKVFEAAVVGQSDPILGEAICAFVILKEGENCLEKELLHLCHEHLPIYKMPRKIHFTDTFPRTESGKIKKEELKRLHNLIEVAK